jgi:hypothetical protein
MHTIDESPRRYVQYPPLPGTLPSHTAEVQPGFHRFSTITAALESITGASELTPYQVHLGPGTYQEQVVCKPWVRIVGPSSGTATITYTAPVPTEYVPIVTAASFSSIAYVTISATATLNSKILHGVQAEGVDDFEIAVCQIHLSDGAGPIEIAGISVIGGSGYMTVNQCQVTVSVASAGTQSAFGLYVLGASAAVFFENGSLITTNTTASPIDIAGFTEGGQIMLRSSAVTGASMALTNGGSGSISADGCTIVGTIGTGVVILPPADARPRRRKRARLI